MELKYKVGDKVRIVKKWCGDHRENRDGQMDKWLGKVMTIRSTSYSCYKMDEDNGQWFWYDSMIDELVRDEMKPKFKVGDLVRGNSKSDDRYAFTNSNMTKGKVTNVRCNGCIDIKVLEHKSSTENGITYTSLEPKYFDLIKSATPDWKVIIIPDGDKTIGKLFENGKLTTKVETKKHPKDEYSINEAIKSITTRLVEEHDERKHKFEIGDIVELVDKDTGLSPIPVGARGEVVAYSPRSMWDIGVDFKMNYGYYTHDLDGEIKTRTGRWYKDYHFKLVSRP